MLEVTAEYATLDASGTLQPKAAPPRSAAPAAAPRPGSTSSITPRLADALHHLKPLSQKEWMMAAVNQ